MKSHRRSMSRSTPFFLVVLVLWASGLGTFAQPQGADRTASKEREAFSRAGRADANWTLPRTAWGDPDLSGIWNYATMTPLERPRELAGKEVLTDAEAAAYERQTIERQSVTNNT